MKRMFCVAVLMASGCAGEAGVTLTTLHLFDPFPNGQRPLCTLVPGDSGEFYGTTILGGAPDFGTIFKLNTNGSLTTLHSFSGVDGEFPYAGLVRGRDGNLYGTTESGGSNFSGSIFQISTNGGFASLYSFTDGNDGASPFGSLVQGINGEFYGTTETAGTNDAGTIFKISSGGEFTSLYSFTGGNDGANPYCGLALGSDGYFYGTASAGGANNAGTVFRISTAGALTTLYSFTGGNDGANPYAGLVQAGDGFFYGTTDAGGLSNSGTIFKIGGQGNLTTLHLFNYDSDGAAPRGALVQGGDGNLYGTAASGLGGYGSVFKISAEGQFAVLHSFEGGGDGAGSPWGGLVQGSDGYFRGTFSGETGGGDGGVFRINSSGDFSVVFFFTDGYDGANPQAALVQGNDGFLYGAAYGGAGTLFKISANGTSYANLYSFGYHQTPPDLVKDTFGLLYGMTPSGSFFRLDSGGTVTELGAFGLLGTTGLLLGSDGNFYGAGLGAIFEIDQTGATLTNLYQFTNSDGASYNPNAQMVRGSDGSFYATTFGGGAYGLGGIFKITTNGAYTGLVSFDGTNGGYPVAALAQGMDGDFYGSTSDGSTYGAGTIFRVTTNGALATLYKFTGGDDGSGVSAPLVQGYDGCFYGSTYTSSANGLGTIFKITTNGALTTLYSFTGGNDGARPLAGLLQLSNGTFYGTTSGGGLGGAGTIFRMTVLAEPAPVFQTFSLTNGILNLSWSTEAGFLYQLQYKNDFNSANWTNLGSPVTAYGSALSVSNSVSNASQRFYRVVLWQ